MLWPLTTSGALAALPAALAQPASRRAESEGFSKARTLGSKGNMVPSPLLPPPGPGPCYLQDLLVIKFTEDSAADLVGLQRRPIEDRQPELGLDRLLDANG